MLIPLTEYAKNNGRSIDTARDMALRGGFKTARKMGRDWVIEDDEPYPDRRVKSGEYRNWRKPKLESEIKD